MNKEGFKCFIIEQFKEMYSPITDSMYDFEKVIGCLDTHYLDVLLMQALEFDTRIVINHLLDDEGCDRFQLKFIDAPEVLRGGENVYNISSNAIFQTIQKENIYVLGEKIIFSVDVQDLMIEEYLFSKEIRETQSKLTYNIAKKSFEEKADVVIGMVNAWKNAAAAKDNPYIEFCPNNYNQQILINQMNIWKIPMATQKELLKTMFIRANYNSKSTYMTKIVRQLAPELFVAKSS